MVYKHSVRSKIDVFSFYKIIYNSQKGDEASWKNILSPPTEKAANHEILNITTRSWSCLYFDTRESFR